jgi:predicted ester cyclase
MENLQQSLSYTWFNEVWNKNSESAIDKYMASTAPANGILKETDPSGAEGFKLFFRNFTGTYRDIHVEIQQVVAEGGFECARSIVRATHAATNRKVEFTGMTMIHVVDGKITEAWNNFDFLTMHQQLGQTLTAIPDGEAALQ